METAGSKVYKITNKSVVAFELKYRTKKQMKFDCMIVVRCVGEYLIIYNDVYICIFNGYNQIYDLFNVVVMYPAIISQVNNYIVIRTNTRNIKRVKSITINLKNKTISTEYPIRCYYQLLESANKKMVLVRKGFVHDLYESCTNVKICNVDEKYLDLPFSKQKCKFLLWKNDNEIAEFDFQLDFSKIIIYGLDFISKNVISIDPKFNPDYKNIAINNDIIYMWNPATIAIIDGYIRYIQNTKQIIIYNSYYGLFINDKMEQFKICDVMLVPYKHKYDLWNDLDKPSKVENIIDALICLNLLPDDVINVIYSFINETIFWSSSIVDISLYVYREETNQVQ